MATEGTRVATAAPAKAVVDVAIAMLRPVIEAAIADAEVSADRALVIVVLDRADAHGGDSLAEYQFGNAGRTSVDYAAHAREKARVAQRERSDTSTVREREESRGAKDLPLVGGIHRRGVTLGVSGAQPWFDEAFGVIVVELVHALEQQGVA